jgi:HSP20 family protein
MNNLIRWRPANEILAWRPWSSFWDRDFEEFLADFAEPSWREPLNVRPWTPRVESYQKNGSFVIKADVPGVNAKDIHVMVEGDHLIIQGERKMDRETKKRDLLRKEVFYGAFQRSVPVPRGLKTEAMKAKYHDGVLEITAPVDKESLPKKIEVEVQKA